MSNELTLFEERYKQIMLQYADLEREVSRLEDMKKTVRAEIQKGMEDNNIRSFDNDFLRLTLVAPSVSTTINTTELRNNDPDTYEALLEAYPKRTERRQSLRVTIK